MTSVQFVHGGNELQASDHYPAIGLWGNRGPCTNRQI